MRLYRTEAGEWAGTQADAKELAGKAWREVEVPTDKPGLLAWLNAHAGKPAPAAAIVAAALDRLTDATPIAFEVPTAENFDAMKAIEGDYGPGTFIPGPGMVMDAIVKAEGGVLAGYVLETIARLGTIKETSLSHVRAFARQHRQMRPQLDRGMVRLGAIALFDLFGE